MMHGHKGKAVVRFLMVLAACVMLALPAAAQSLESAKAAGQVGELPNGYLGMVGSQPAAIKRMVDEINLKRREYYRQIAAKQNTSLAAVEKVYGEQIQAEVRPGEYIADTSGTWRQK